MLNINLYCKNGKTAMATLKIELLDKTELEIIAYNEIADYVFRNLKKNDAIFANGRITENKVEIKEILIREGTTKKVYGL